MTYPYVAPDTVVDGQDVTAEVFNSLANPLIDLLAMLGDLPQGSAGSLTERLDAEHGANGTHGNVSATALTVAGNINANTGILVGLNTGNNFVSINGAATGAGLLLLQAGVQKWSLKVLYSSDADQIFLSNASNTLVWEVRQNGQMGIGGAVVGSHGLAVVGSIYSTTNIVGLTSDNEWIGRETTNSLMYHSSFGTFLNSSGSIRMNIDSNNDGTTGAFDVAKDVADYTGGTTILRVTEAGAMFLNTSSNANMTQGLTINQGANDDQIFALKSSDVNHTDTTDAEITTYSFIQKHSGTSGGFAQWGLSSAHPGIRLVSACVTEDTSAPSASSLGYILLDARRILSNSSANDPSAAAILLAVRQRNTTRFVIQGDGDFYSDGAANTYDTYDDVQLVRALEHALAPEGVVKSEFDAWLTYNRADLVAAGILSAASNFVNWPQLIRLHSGAIWQVFTQLQSMKEEIARLQGGAAWPSLS